MLFSEQHKVPCLNELRSELQDIGANKTAQLHVTLKYVAENEGGCRGCNSKAD